MERINEDFTKLYKRWKGGELRKENKYEFVDLGLPSGNLWATCNIGSTNVLDPGGFFAWGELKEKDMYNGDTYEFEIQPYNANKKFKLDEDFAKSLIGSECRIPTEKDFYELLLSCNVEQISNYNDSGYEVMTFTPKKGRKKDKPTLIFPLYGYKLANTLHMEGSVSLLWTSNFSTEWSKAKCVKMGFDDMEFKNIYVYTGCNMRCIKNKENQ